MIEIVLTQGKTTLVDDCDAHLAEHRWYAVRFGRTFYAARSLGKSLHLMHREILGAKSGETVDHVNGNGLDNRRTNLRMASQGENNCNARIHRDSHSGYRGVSWDRFREAWAAKINVNKKQHFLGRFPDAAAAARAYDAAARKFHGRFASVNFPQGNERGARE